MLRKGDPASLNGPDLIASVAIPSFTKVPLKSTICMTTPIEPVTLVRSAIMTSAAHAR